eukprot:scaffold153868_cov36-Tisochrysis_lutea.AAC.2
MEAAIVSCKGRDRGDALVHLECSDGLSKLLDKFLSDATLDKEAVGAHACLAGVAKLGCNSARNYSA